LVVASGCPQRRVGLCFLRLASRAWEGLDEQMDGDMDACCVMGVGVSVAFAIGL
jgi:hypothetical protein